MLAPVAGAAVDGDTIRRLVQATGGGEEVTERTAATPAGGGTKSRSGSAGP